MSKPRRSRLFWAVCIVLLIAVAAAVLAHQLGRLPVARVTWTYKPVLGKHPLLDFYTRPRGGCFVVNHDGTLLLLDAKGRPVAQYQLPQGHNFWKAAIDPEGNLYAGSLDLGAVFAFDSAGKLRWRCDIPNQAALAAPPPMRGTVLTLGPDGKLYVGLNTGELAVLDPSGRIERRLDAGMKLSNINGPALAPEGGFYLIAWPKDVIRVSAQGKLLWRVPTHGFSINQLASSPDGTVYIVAHQDRFYAYWPDGRVRWEYVDPDTPPARGWAFYDFTADPAGDVYITSGRRLAVFKPDGTPLWNRKLNGAPDKPLIDGSSLYVQVAIGRSSLYVHSLLSRLGIYPGGNQYSYVDDTYYELYRLDRSSGKTTGSWQLPDKVSLWCGPGPQGEFYGSTSGPAGAWHNQIVRIDLR